MATIRDGVSSHDFANHLAAPLPMSEHHHTDSTDHPHKHMEQPIAEDHPQDIDTLEQFMSKTDLELAKIDFSKSLTALPRMDFPSATQPIPDMFFRDLPWNPLGSSAYTHQDALSKLQEAIESTAAGHIPKTYRKPSKHGRAHIISDTESTRSYVTAKTSSTASYCTASSAPEGSRNHHTLHQIPEEAPRSSWYNHLEGRGMIPDPFDEKDWSGRGQHAEFEPDEVNLIPLKVEKVLGYTASALVESVLCRRIRLARKTIKCGRRIRREDAVTEVQHLQRLSHFHLVQVIGTYIMGKDLSILLYPVAEYNLETLMDSMVEDITKSDEDSGYSSREDKNVHTDWYPQVLYKFFGCLSNALHYLHINATKHMDIKPKNLLVRRIAGLRLSYSSYQIYIADFGIARSYKSVEDSETDSPTSFTRIYSAPEVVRQERRGLSADIFSMGCVFLEMLATMLCTWSEQDELQKLKDLRTKNINGDISYQANIPDLQAWLRHVNNLLRNRPPNLHKRFVARFDLPILVQRMLESDPSLRPSANDIAEYTSPLCCLLCNNGREQLEAV